MRGFYWGTGVVHCSFCGGKGHNVTTCKFVNEVASKYFKRIESGGDPNVTSIEAKALREIKNRETKKARKVLKRKRRKPRCSYCGSEDHKRPKCHELKKFKKLFHQANKNWKTQFVKKINEKGIGVGSLIKVNSDFFPAYSQIDGHPLALVVEYNTSNMNVFCAWEHYGDYQNNSSFKVLFDDNLYNINLHNLSGLLGGKILRKNWWVASAPEIVNPVEWIPDPMWINSEYDEIVEWFFNDINNLSIRERGIYDFIDKWAKVFS